jgi:hypothetical protein
MSYAEEVLKLRKKLVDAVSAGVVDPNSKGTVEAFLIQIMNESEKNRQQCTSQAEDLRKRAAMLDGQASAFTAVSSIVYNVINGFTQAAERDRRERERAAQEDAEKQAAIEAAKAAQSSDSQSTEGT